MLFDNAPWYVDVLVVFLGVVGIFSASLSCLYESTKLARAGHMCIAVGWGGIVYRISNDLVAFQDPRISGIGVVSLIMLALGGLLVVVGSRPSK